MSKQCICRICGAEFESRQSKACFCSHECKKRDNARQQLRRMSAKRAADGGFIPCACGCGTLIRRLTQHGTPARFKHGHNDHVRVTRSPRVEGDVACVPLTRGMEAVIDAADVPLVDGNNWAAVRTRRGTHYATCGRGGRKVALHQVILGLPHSTIIDHADGDGLNNRRSNLRPASCSLNGANSRQRRSASGLRGVVPLPGGTWAARITIDYRPKHLGCFPSKEQAGKAYDAAAALHFGEFARLNFPVAQ